MSPQQKRRLNLKCLLRRDEDGVEIEIEIAIEIHNLIFLIKIQCSLTAQLALT